MNQPQSITLEKTADLLNAANSVIIASHESPDPDGLSCTIALGLVLKQLGKTVKLYNIDKVPKNLRFLPGHQLLTQQLSVDEPFDLAIIVDLGELNRVGPTFAGLKNVKAWLALDHHASGPYPLKNNYLDSSASSSGILLDRIFRHMGIALNKDLATLIYTSISADTGSFKYSNVNPECLEVASRMVAQKINVWEVAQYLWELSPLARIKLMARVLPSLEMHLNDQVAGLTILQEDFKASGATEELTGGLIDIPRSIETVEIAFNIREIGEDFFKISMRSKNYADVAAIAAHFGGGGHVRAAGCKIKGNAAEVKQKLLTQIKLQIK